MYVCGVHLCASMDVSKMTCLLFMCVCDGCASVCVCGMCLVLCLVCLCNGYASVCGCMSVCVCVVCLSLCAIVVCVSVDDVFSVLRVCDGCAFVYVFGDVSCPASDLFVRWLCICVSLYASVCRCVRV